MGWHISLYHSHLIVTPPAERPTNWQELESAEASVGWHQDSGRLNKDLEGDPRPMVSKPGGCI